MADLMKKVVRKMKAIGDAIGGESVTRPSTRDLAEGMQNNGALGNAIMDIKSRSADVESARGDTYKRR